MGSVEDGFVLILDFLFEDQHKLVTPKVAPSNVNITRLWHVLTFFQVWVVSWKRMFSLGISNVISSSMFRCGFSLGMLPFLYFSSVQSLSHVWLCDPMNHSTPGLPVHHQLPEFTQTYIHQVGDAIQPSHPLSSPSPHAPNPSQHQGLFQWVNSSHEVARVLEFQL